MNDKMSFDLFKAFYRQIQVAVEDGGMDVETATALVWAVTAGEGTVTTADILADVRELIAPYADALGPLGGLELICVDAHGMRVAEFVDLQAPPQWSPDKLPAYVLDRFLAAVKEAMTRHGANLHTLPPGHVAASGQGAMAMLEQSMREQLVGDSDRIIDEFRAEIDRVFGTYNKGGGEL